jgi:diaminohydroxyphosphoribosylaminopyrimidine deaminase/5-amino-6-(5-phosphoribosylamino)uracil reductase
VASEYDRQKAQRLINIGAEIIEVPASNGQVDLKELIVKLGELKIDSILLEGGGTLNFSALNSGIVDMVVSFIAPMIIGGSNAKTPIEGQGFKLTDATHLTDIHIKEYCGDCLVYGMVERS